MRTIKKITVADEVIRYLDIGFEVMDHEDGITTVGMDVEDMRTELLRYLDGHTFYKDGEVHNDQMVDKVTHIDDATLIDIAESNNLRDVENEYYAYKIYIWEVLEDICRRVEVI